MNKKNKKERDAFQIGIGGFSIFSGLLLVSNGLINWSTLSYEQTLIIGFNSICLICFGVIFLELRQ